MWNYLKTSDKPIVLYGTGNACQRIIDKLNAEDIKIAGIFASDGFVRDRSFAGHKVRSYAECKKAFGDMIVLVCFGSHLPEVIANIKKIAGEQELYMPDLPVIGEGFFTRDYAKQKHDDLVWLNSVLADDESRQVLADILTYRQSGVIDYLLRSETSDDDNWRLLDPNAEDVFMDLGAYTGDTVQQFIRLAGGYKRIIAVEPEERNFRKLFENTKLFDNVQLVNAAIGEAFGELLFTHGAGRGGADGKGKTRPVIQETVDRLSGLDESEMQRMGSFDADAIGASTFVPSFIKMDLEGAEQRAIEGAAKTIKEYNPKLLIAAYHRIDDLWTLPKQLLSINPDYKIYLRKSPCLPAWEINYYCKVE